MTPFTYSPAPERITRIAATLFVPAGLGSRCERQGTQKLGTHRDRTNPIFAA
jgi:hypothetical protein